MKILGTFVTCIFLSVISFASIASVEPCGVNCLTHEKVGGKILITWFDAEGEEKGVFTEQIDSDATLTGKSVEETHLSGTPRLTGDLNSMDYGDSGTIKTEMTTYDTVTYVVVFTSIMYFGANGNLIDVKVDLNNFARSLIK